MNSRAHEMAILHMYLCTYLHADPSQRRRIYARIPHSSTCPPWTNAVPSSAACIDNDGSEGSGPATNGRTLKCITRVANVKNQPPDFKQLIPCA